MVRLIGPLLLVGACLHAQSAAPHESQPRSLFYLTPMIGATVDVAPYGIEEVYASLAVAASYGKTLSVSLCGVLLASREAVYFRFPLILSLHWYPPLGLLFGGGPGSFGYGTSSKIFTVFYGGVTWSWSGWSLTAVVSDVVGSNFSDLLLDVYVGRVIEL